MKHGVRAAALACAALAWAHPARADIVIDWADFANRINNKAEERTPVTFAANPQVALAMFEAANAIDHRYQSYLGMPPAAPGASEDAAIMAAAHAVLAACYPDQKKMIDENYAVAIEQVPDGPARQAGIAVGEAAAAKAMTHGVVDKAIAQQPFRPATSPGVWIGAQLPVFDTWFQALQPFAIGRVDALRPPPPPALTSARYAKENSGRVRTPSAVLRSSCLVWNAWNGPRIGSSCSAVRSKKSLSYSGACALRLFSHATR